MNLISIILTAVALSLDAVAVAAANGAKHHRMSLTKALEIACFFGFFQGLMPIIGWYLGATLKQIIGHFDHWIAFSLLAILGIKMIYESIQTTAEKDIDIHSKKILLLLSIATSIDALAIGTTFAFLSISIIRSSAIICLTTFVLSFVAIYVGKKFGEAWGKKTETVGGIILILVGLKILTSHLFGW